MAKAQILAGGRGKAGGIKACKNTLELEEALVQLTASSLKGERVAAVLVEEQVEILQELYLSLTFDSVKGVPVLVASAAGGIEIEKVAEETPHKILKIFFHPLVGIKEYQIRYAAKELGCADASALKQVVENLYRVFKECQASLVEINPLAITPAGFVALDAKVILDPKGAGKNPDLFQRIQSQQSHLQETSLDEDDDTLTYVPLEGSIAVISDGAGTGMLTLDLLKDAGGEAANFCEMGGITNPDIMFKAMEKVLGKPGVKSLLIVLIGGFNRMDEMAEGIVRFKEKRGLPVPIAVRMCGTLEEVGKEIMAAAGIPTFDHLHEAVAKIMALTGGD